ncbi:MAG: hypothetical protein CMJ72_07315 [Planctomycetaceae bacterium]|nr:hypothetical protein [Planctomycetaceae bacterium]HCK42463.1 hypothetical protein [Planctomycetaceae bacterium]
MSFGKSVVLMFGSLRFARDEFKELVFLKRICSLGPTEHYPRTEDLPLQKICSRRICCSAVFSTIC